MSNTQIDLFRCCISPEAGEAIKTLFTPDANGRIYVGEGQRVVEFEKEFANTVGLNRQLLGVNSATSAIDLALHLIGVQPDDEVICSAMNCTASNGSVVTRGAKIVWADVYPLTGLINPASVARVISNKTKAIIAVDWAGRHCNYKVLREFGIPVIEDAAHCLYLGEENGDYVAYSYGPIKFLSMGGYGGGLVPPEEQYDRARLLRWHGLDRLSSADYRCEQDIKEVGFRYHLTDDLATIGLSNLELAQQNVAKSRMNSDWYKKNLDQIHGIKIPPYDPRCNYWLFTVLVENDRDGFQKRMAKYGVATSPAHARNDHHSAFRAATVRQDGDLLGTTLFSEKQTNIPVNGWVTESDRQRVTEAVQASVTE